jgi:cytochrome c553
MAPVAAGLSHTAMRELARYYSEQENPSPSSPTAEIAPAIARGKAIANQGLPAQRVPSCVDCHGPGTAQRNPIYPTMAGQYADYIVSQLELFTKGQRGGSPYAHLMHPIAARLKPEQRRDVALYYESLTSAHDRPPR